MALDQGRKQAIICIGTSRNRPAGVTTQPERSPEEGEMSAPSTGGPGAKRPRALFAVALVVVVALVGVLLAVVLPGSSGPSLSGKTPQQILAKTIAAADEAASAHLVITTNGTTSAIGDIGSGVGRLTVPAGDGRRSLSVILTGSGVFVRFLSVPSPIYESQLAKLAHGRWISSPVSRLGQWDSNLVDLAFVLRRDFALTSPLKAVAQHGAGTGAVVLTGSLPETTVGAFMAPGRSVTSQSGASGVLLSVTLTVSAASPFYPISLSATDAGGATTMYFTKWGETVSVSAPAGAVPLSSL
jgi:lipoprotein LprG